MIIGFGTFVTMTFSNVLLSDYVDLKSVLTVKAATLKKDFKGEIPKIYDSDLTCFDTLSYTYNDKGRILKEENSDGSSVSYEYDAWGKCVSTVTTHDNDFADLLMRICHS